MDPRSCHYRLYFWELVFLTGACIVFEKKARTVSLLTGTLLLLIFCFYYIPYEFMSSERYMHLVQWENAEKELAFCSGAFVIAGCFSEKNETLLNRSLGKLIPLGPILFSIPIISFGILHFLNAKDVADYVPSWVPARLFWAYFCGAALIGSGLAIILKIKIRTSGHSFGHNDLYLGYYSPHPKSNSFSCHLHGK